MKRFPAFTDRSPSVGVAGLCAMRLWLDHCPHMAPVLKLLQRLLLDAHYLDSTCILWMLSEHMAKFPILSM